ncbi:MAG: hypothetical protein C0522_11710 [Rhodocyclaceae bacterium]|nr:hypothetical protein [Rhodocyclaceae bacterium]
MRAHVEVWPFLKVTVLYYAPEFFLGVLVWRFSRLTGTKLLTAAGSVAAAAVAVAWLTADVGLLVAAGIFGTIVGYTWRERMQEGLGQGALQFLGNISYSLYLIHVPVIAMILAVLTRLGAGSTLGSWMALLASFAASILVAWCLNRWVEVPAIGWSRKVSMSARRGANLPGAH